MLIDRSVSISNSQLTSVSHVAIFLLLYIALVKAGVDRKASRRYGGEHNTMQASSCFLIDGTRLR